VTELSDQPTTDYPLHRPTGGFRHGLIGKLRQLPKRLQEFLASTATHGDGDVAQKAGVLRPQNGAVAKRIAKFGFAQSSQFFERRSKMARRKCRFVGSRRPETK
jgi:hypothetical protein